MPVRHTSIVITFIVLMFIADSINAVLINLNSPFGRVSIVIRLLAQGYFLWLLLHKSLGRRILLIVLCFYVIFFVGTFAALNSYDNYEILGNFSAVNKMLFFIICWGVFSCYFKTVDDISKLLQWFEIIILLQVISVILGFVLNLHYFASYPNGERFGYKGLIPAINEVSGFFVIAFFYYLQKIVLGKPSVIMLTLVIIAWLLTGAKVALILPMILLFYILKWIANGRLKKSFLGLSIGVSLLIVVAILLNDYFLTRLLPSINYFTDHWLQGRTFFSLFMSGRDLKVNYLASEILPDFNFVNYIFGGIDLVSFSTETDAIDVFVRFGLIGGLFFYCLYICILLGDIRAISFTQLLFVITWLGVSMTAGHLVFSAINGVYLAIILLTFSNRQVFDIHSSKSQARTHSSKRYQPFTAALVEVPK